jgi:DNA-binding MarR family transcriptional regulator
MKHPSIRSVGWLLMQAARLHRSYLGEQLEDQGLYAGQEQVLWVLRATKHISISELAQILQVAVPTASKMLKRLSTFGLIERIGNIGDRRSVWLRLTAKGDALAAAIEDSWKKVEDDLLRDFDDKEKRRLRKLLWRASANLAEALGGNELNFNASRDVLDEHLPSWV